MKKYIVFLGLSLVLLACGKEDKDVVPVKADISYGEMKDERDGAIYKTIQIGDQVWMAENLRYRLPAGSLDGCYTFGEVTTNWALLSVNKASFVDLVKAAISRGEIVDPPGLPTAQQPIYIINTYINLLTPSQLMNRLVAHPKVLSVVDGINEKLKGPASIIQAKVNLDAAEAQNGGYTTKFGFLYTHDALDDVAPEGWRVPTDAVWNQLESALGMSTADLDRINAWRGSVSTKLIEEQEQSLGFNAQLGGGRVYGSFLYGTNYINRAVSGYYWSSDLVEEADATQLGVVRQFMRNNKGIWRGTSRMEAAYHVKCIKIN